MRKDFIIIGGGVAGAAAGYFLSSAGDVVLLEQEDQFGFHSSGRTAGQYTVGISADQMRALAAASRAFLRFPPEGFCESPLFEPRGSLTVARNDQRPLLERLHSRIVGAGGSAASLDRKAAHALFPALRPEMFDIGVHESDAADIDVHALLHSYLRGARRNGAETVRDARVTAIRREGGLWYVTAGAGIYVAPAVINAAGGWSDLIAAMAGVPPVGLIPYKRTAFTFALPPGGVGPDWPHVCNADYRWYVKPERGRFVGSPADAMPVDPADVHPDDLDVARGIFNIEQDTSLRIGRPLAAWAGMRSYVRDREPVCGAPAGAPGFIWMAGQGGCGVLTSPAMGRAAAALAQGLPLPEDLRAAGVVPEKISPERASLMGG